MPAFFIDRPVFVWVVALLISLGGLLAIPFLAVAQYPIIAPPSISISTSYPGATPENLYNSVTRLIEEELNGANGILNFESTSDSLGQVEITANFVPGTDTTTASVEVQNRIKRVEARLPRAVMQQGILIEEASSAVLQIITLRATDGSLDEVGLGDFMVHNILGEIRRIPGVGRATLYSTERALRVWIDPTRLVGFGLTADDVTNAISAQNAQVASGSIGVEPSKPYQQLSALVLVKGQFATPEGFGAIVLRANPDGSTVRLRDVARVEVGGLSYQFTTRRNGEPVAGLSVLLAPKANALATATAVKAKMEALSQFFPANIKYDISYDITPVVVASIKKVLTTLAEAVVLVFLVMLLFLQNIRYTIIPTVVVPVALLGTCGILLLLGFSINVLTLFGMVLAIGILVDDAIVVVENVERIMSEEGLSPRDATRKAMRQITGAIIGITLVLVSVFVPMAFFPGSVGIIYRQFSASMIAAIGLSSLLALSLTPALCATILKPVAAGHHHAARGPFGWFNRRIEEAKGGYAAWVRWSILRAGRLMLIYAGMLAAVAFAFIRLPGAFAGRRSGLRHGRRAHAAGGLVSAHARRGQARRGLSDKARRHRHRDIPDRLQLSRPGPEYRAGLHHPEGLVGAAQVRLRRSHRPRYQSHLCAAARRQSLRIAAAADRQSRQFQRLQLPPAGSRPARLCRTDARERPVARRRRAKPGASGRLCRRIVARAASRAGHRSREGGCAWGDLRGDQQRHLDQSRLRLHQ